MAKDAINPDSVVMQAEGLMSSELDGETVLMSVERPAYYGVEGTADRIWKLLEEPRRVAELCAMLAAEYAVDGAACRRQVCDFLAELEREGLLRVVAELA